MNVYMTRQPIFGRYGNVVAYELLYRGSSEKNRAASVPEDESDEQGYTNDLFGLDMKSILSGAKLYINFTDELIIQGAPRRFSPEVLDVGISAKQLKNAGILETVKALKESGYLIVLNDLDYTEENKELLMLSDIAVLDIKAPQQSLEFASAMCRSLDKVIFAKNVNTNVDFEYARKLGCTYMQGYFYTRSSVSTSRSAQPLPVNLVQAMQLMAQPDPEINDIVDVMSRDAVLCQKILKLINSVYFGVSNKVSSINQAILILGLDYLREWVYLMGMQKISQNDNTEVMRLSLLIAKFCRGLSELIPETADNGDAFYLMGLLSMIVLSSDRALAQALDEFPLANEIKKGLLRCGGTYSDVFEMALSYVDGRWDSFNEAAAKYGLDTNKTNDIFVHCMQEIGKLNMS